MRHAQTAGEVEATPTLSVAEAVGLADEAVRAAVPGRIRLVAEIRKASRWGRGGRPMCFLELADADGGASPVEMRAVIGRGELPHVERRVAEAGAELAAGSRVHLLGELGVYRGKGEVQLRVVDVDVQSMVGAAQQVRRQLLADLEQAGALAANGHRWLRRLPRRVVVIASRSSAAVTDFVAHLPEGQGWQLEMVDVAVQGRDAPSSIAAALRAVSAHDGIDAVALLRGGGGTSDLAVFDSPEVAWAITECAVPVIVGVGHERDRTVACEVAHSRVATPTAAAELLAARWQDAHDELTALADRLAAASRLLASQRHALASLASRTRQAVRGAVSAHRRDVDAIAPRLGRAARACAARRHQRLGAAAGALARLPRQMAAERKQVDATAARGARAARNQLDRAGQRLTAGEQRAAALDPARVLERGYTLTMTAQGRVLPSAGEARTEPLWHTRFVDGEVASRPDPEPRWEDT